MKNADLTVYHKDFDENNNIEIWTRFNYENIWWFGGRGAGTNKGYDDANDVEIRIFYQNNPSLDVKNFKVGDILIKGNLTLDIITQQDLDQEEIYNITAITDNTFGTRPHIHLGGK